jgi:acetyltransferase-like isoleucine patch superfamily enzyme
LKATFADYATCGAAIGLLAAAAVAVVFFGARPLTLPFLHEYHVVADALVLLAAYGILSGLAVRILVTIKPIQAGEYSMDSPAFTYWKLLTIIYRLGQAALLPFTPVFARPLVARLFGARIGRNVAIGGVIDDPYMVSLGDGAVLGNNCLVSGNVIANGRITIGRVNVGSGATVGVNCVVLPGTVVGDRAILIGGSIAVAGTTIPPGETWRGNPARKWQ